MTDKKRPSSKKMKDLENEKLEIASTAALNTPPAEGLTYTPLGA